MIHSTMKTRYIAIQFGNIEHFHEGLSEFGRHLGTYLAKNADRLHHTYGWRFHFHLPEKWHGLFGNTVDYRPVTGRQRIAHLSETPYAVWHALHQHIRYRPPLNCAKRVMTVHDLNHLYAKTGASLLWQKIRIRHQMSAMNGLIAISQYVADDIQKNLNWAPPVQTIYNGVADLSQIQQTPVASLLGRSFFFHISRMSENKNVASLIRLASAWPEKTFVLSGPDSAQVHAHKDHVARLKLNNVIFETDITEGQKAWLYANCDAFLFPSLFEGFGLPPAEAMRFHKPLFVSALSCMPEICGEGACYWHEFSPEYMRNVIEQGLLKWPEKATAQTDMLLRYDWETTGAAYVKAYAAL
jgi:glycosyltransferase involved in cell wall biosynthesis